MDRVAAAFTVILLGTKLDDLGFCIYINLVGN
jgi:hypothetical protein